MVLVRVAFRLGWYCGYCVPASAVLDFRGFRYVAAAANVVGERTRRLENKRAFGRIYVVDAPSGARLVWRRAGDADGAASACPTSLGPTCLGPSSLGRGRARRRAAGDR